MYDGSADGNAQAAEPGPASRRYDGVSHDEIDRAEVATGVGTYEQMEMAEAPRSARELPLLARTDPRARRLSLPGRPRRHRRDCAHAR